MTTIINLFGGPGCGKSTTAAGLFHLMKCEGYKVELVTEYAKDLEYMGTLAETPQRDIFTTQKAREDKLVDKVDYIITDSPLLMSLAYTPDEESELYDEVLTTVMDSRRRRRRQLNVMLARNKKYETYGRKQDITQAKVLDSKILNILDTHEIPYKFLDIHIRYAAKALLEWIQRDDAYFDAVNTVFRLAHSEDIMKEQIKMRLKYDKGWL